MNEVGFSYSKHSWHGVSKGRVGEPCVVTRATLQLGGHSSRCRQTDRQTDLCGPWGVWGSALQQHRVFGVGAELHLSACSTCVTWILAGLDAKPSETIFWEADSFWDVCCVIPAQNWLWSRDTCIQIQNLDLSSIMDIVISLLFQSVLNYFFNMLKYDKKSILVHCFTYFIVFYMSGVLKASYTSCQISCGFCPLCMLK